MKKKLSVIQINDTHSYLEPHAELFYSSDEVTVQQAGGFARIKTLLKEYRKEQPTLILDNGDTFHGTFEAVTTKGRHMIPTVNALGIQAMTFHWDIGYGPENLKALGEELDYPILAINAYRKDTNDLYFDPYTILQAAGLSIGVIGIAATIIDKTMPPHFSEGLYFTMGNEELPRYIKELKNDKKVDLIIVLSHLGFPQDVKMMQEIEGVDLCLSGHTHNRLAEPVQVGNTTIIQSGSQGSFIGKVDLTLEDNKVTSLAHSLIRVTEDIQEDSQVKKLVEQAVGPYKEELSRQVGKTSGLLHRGWALESTMDNFLLEAIQHQTKSDLVFSNGWRYGAPIETGTITLKQLHQIIPVNPPLSTVEMSGREVLEMLEENLEHTYASDPYQQMGGYVKRSLGLKVFFKVENPKGHRIQTLLINEKPVELERIYLVSYVTNQGVPKKYGKDHQHLDMHAVDALQKLLDDKGTYHPQLYGTYEVI